MDTMKSGIYDMVPGIKGTTEPLDPCGDYSTGSRAATRILFTGKVGSSDQHWC